MNDPINEHRFNFKLPMYPNRKIGERDLPAVLEMDGKHLPGVTDLTVRAGSNGFTNVVIEFEADVAVEFVGHLVANLNLTEDQAQILFGGIFDKAVEAYPILREFQMDGADKIEIVKTIIEQALARIK
jgi:hypothetical protein